MRVLIVDDEPDILLVLRLILEEVGHEVLLAADGERALERIAVDRPDFVLLDVMMPVLDGWGVLDALRDRDDAPPVLVVSGKTDGADVAHAVALGARGFLTKPFEPDDVVRAVTLDGHTPER
jgi:two-component system alkaline phosphatase synthesis response regulator PhoP